MASSKDVSKSEINNLAIKDSLRRMSAMQVSQSLVDKVSLKNVNLEKMTLSREPRIDTFYTEEMIYYMSDLLLLRG